MEQKPILSDLCEQTLFNHLLLHRLPGFGPGLYWRLAATEPPSPFAIPNTDAHRVLGELGAKALRELRQLGDKSPLAKQATADLRWAESHCVSILYPQHPDYPPLLREISRAPFVLYAKGDLGCLNAPQLAVVGSRRPSTYGCENARNFSRHMANSGMGITSGLALGVDGVAHEAALAVGGKTIAVMATGMDRVYPTRHRHLAQRIVQNGGLLLTEFPPGASPLPGHFPQRNRIISGLSLGVLVPEAKLKSGSLITARYALEQNREVFTIPGSIHNPMSRGCHQLIRQGATLVETAEDIFNELEGFLLPNPAIPKMADTTVINDSINDKARRLLSALSEGPLSIDALVDCVNMDVGELTAEMISMEIQGWVLPCVEGYKLASGLDFR